MTKHIEKLVKELGKKGKKASLLMSNISIQKRNEALDNISALINYKQDLILEANKKDLNKAIKNNLDDAKIDRLSLNEKRIRDIRSSLQDIINFGDPINKILAKNTGQTVKKIEVDTDRDNFMTAAEAKRYGIIDTILTARK